MPSITFTEIARLRLEAISFFLVVFLACAGVVMAIWNGFRKEIPTLPRLSYFKAVGLTTIWGMLFLLVLTMISGARELMTPGAWKRDGWTHKLATPDEAEAMKTPFAQERRDALHRVRSAVREFAATNDGRLPTDEDIDAMDDVDWTMPGAGLSRLIVIGAELAADEPTRLLVVEPEIYDERFGISVDGNIREVSDEPIFKGTSP
ncbi:hypothetical protein [Stratiformator vulcanicus]|nr:hypothetical protein [Stratiformator vulcanicus]